MSNVKHFRVVLGLALALMLGLAAVALPVTAQRDERASAPYLGIIYEAADNGVLVANVVPNSPAADAGLLEGDVVTALGDETVTADNIRDIVASYSVGDVIELAVVRNDEDITVEVTLGERGPRREIFGIRGPRPFLGVSMALEEDAVTIEQVQPESPAAEAGFETGDIVTAVNGEAVADVADVIDTVRAAQPGDTLTFDIQRGDEEMTLEATLGEGSPFGRFEFGPGFGPGFDMRGTMNGNAFAYDAANDAWRILNLDEASALYEAGLRAGDTITAINGESMNPASLRSLLMDAEADQTVAVTVERDGETMDIDVTVEALRSFGALSFQFGGREGFRGAMPFMAPGGAQLGVEFLTLDETNAAEHSLDVTEGALITNVRPESPAADAGLQVNDIVTAVDGDLVDEEHTLRDRLFAYEPEDVVTLTVLRDGETMDIDVTLGQFEFGPGMPFGMDFPFDQFDFGNTPPARTEQGPMA